MTSSFRFVHTADIHLDSPLRSLAARHPVLASHVQTASRQALQRTVALCLRERVDALLIAGDLFDGSQKSMHTASALSTAFRQLRDADIAVCVIRGNHDARSQLAAQLAPPDNVTIFSGRRKTVMLQDGNVAVHGVSYDRNTAEESLLPRYPQPIGGAINIGMLHTSLVGDTAHDSYAPCTVAELRDHGYDYWALGHIHKRQVHLEQPAIVMPGIPQGRDVGESGAKSVCLVTMNPGGSASIEEHNVATAQFERLVVDVSGVSDMAALQDQMIERLQQARTSVETEHLIARLDLSGSCSLSRILVRDRDLVLQQARDLAESLNDVWVESVTTDGLSSTENSVSLHHEHAQPLLDELIDAETLRSTRVAELADTEITDLMRALPPEARQLIDQQYPDASEDGEHEAQGLRNAMLREGADFILGHLQAQD